MKFTFTQKDIPNIASEVLKLAPNKIFLFFGDMGVGKTTFIKEMAKQLGVSETTSPTFSIVNEYAIPNDKIYHFDFYRIETIDEVYDIGVEEYLDSGHYLFIEWPDKIKSLLPENSLEVKMIKNADNSRSLTTNLR